MAVSVTPAIPASQLVNVLPSVLAAGGDALDMIGLILTQNTRPPIGEVLSFATADDVADYFGSSTQEEALATIYFNGPNNATALPGALLFAQYPASAVSAFLRGGDMSGISLATLQSYSGTMSVVFDGTTHTGSINLSGAVSFSSAATLIQTALNTATEVTGSIAPNAVTGSIAPNTATGSISGTTMTITAIGAGTVLADGQTVSGASVVANTTIVTQLTGTAGDTGTYQVSVSQSVPSTALTMSGGGLTVSAVTSGTLAVGQTLSGTGVTAGTTILEGGTGTGGTGTYPVGTSQTAPSQAITASGATLTVSAVASGFLAVNDVLAGTGVTLGTKITTLLTGTGGTGTYLVDTAQTASSQTITVSGAGVVVAYDSVSGAFTVTSGITGAGSTAGFATGSIGTNLKLTAATGAVISQGADATDPPTFMDSVTALTQNWVSFMTTWEPTDADKEAFATWTNGEDNRYVYEMWDTDIANTQVGDGSPAVDFINTGQLSGISMVYEDPAIVITPGELAAFGMGWTASLDHPRRNGRQTAAFKGQAGLLPQITTATAANNLKAKGVNFYGTYTTANQAFIEYQTGTISGPFVWKDSYVNQIWLNSQLQLAIMVGLQNTPAVPYNRDGYTLIESFCMDPINEAVNFGAIVPGVELSAAQITAVNQASGLTISDILKQRGWYLQVSPASAQVRRARTSPPCTLWYTDGGSIHQVTLASIEVQ